MTKSSRPPAKPVGRLTVRPPPLPKRETLRVQAREIAVHDEVMVATGGFSPVVQAGFRSGKILIETATGEKTLMAPDTMVAVRR